jgi:hypothetical protein
MVTGVQTCALPISFSNFQIQVVFPQFEMKVAERIARQIGSDFGAAMKSAIVDAKIGRSINKDGKVGLSEASKVKGIQMTNALYVMHALNFAGDAGKFGFAWKNTKFSVLENSALDKALKNLS